MNLKRYHHVSLLEAGCDEAGRGCLAGAVFAAAVILNNDIPIEGLNDSKQLSETRRNTLRVEIEENALAWAVASVSPQEIDEINILQASFLAMHRAIDQLATPPELLLIDGNRFVPYFGVSHLCVIKGDSKYQSIAAASILAKTYRDEYMKRIGRAHPQYDWQQNKGYPTAAHRAAIQQHGVTDYHRKSFRMQK